MEWAGSQGSGIVCARPATPTATTASVIPWDLFIEFRYGSILLLFGADDIESARERAGDYGASMRPSFIEIRELKIRPRGG